MKRHLWGAGCLAILLVCNAFAKVEDKNTNRIKPYVDNPAYWQYNAKPILLLGGSRDDNLFQLSNLKEHLDEIHAAGGNYIRNTMSDRQDQGNEVYPYRQLPNGKYDLNQWNDTYWRRFQNLLILTQERDIIVQIEVWDRFDYADHRGYIRWVKHPYNPKNNVNYTSKTSGLAWKYSKHPAKDKQPFFHTVPGMKKYKKQYDVIRQFQARFVAKMLTYSLPYGHVLYSMNNETSTEPRWGQYWMKFIRAKADAENVDVYMTDMFDDVHTPQRSAKLKQAIAKPELYDFLDISQINSRTFNEDHWTGLNWILRRTQKRPRPLNHIKIYSAGKKSFGSGTPVDGVERFWRNLIGGSASSRFHRPSAGIGLNYIAKACIAAARKIETRIKFWAVTPRLDLLTKREEDEAYLAAKPGEQYLLYFTDGGEVVLDLSKSNGRFKLNWVSINTGEWGDEEVLAGGRHIPISAPSDSGWVAAIVKVRP